MQNLKGVRSVKVISGKLKGRNIKGYSILGTRPTMDRVKESIFGMIQDYVSNSIVLDLFSGSGNYGIEAISNGCQMVYFNDINKKCIKVIQDNLEEFNVLEKGIFTNMDYQEALSYYKSKKLKFDLVFLDPPYKKQVINDVLKNILKNDLLNKNGLIVCELTSNERYNDNKLILYKERKYGEKIVLIYKLVD